MCLLNIREFNHKSLDLLYYNMHANVKFILSRTIYTHPVALYLCSRFSANYSLRVKSLLNRYFMYTCSHLGKGSVFHMIVTEYLVYTQYSWLFVPYVHMYVRTYGCTFIYVHIRNRFFTMLFVVHLYIRRFHLLQPNWL